MTKAHLMKEQLKHFYSRAGFGSMPSDLDGIEGESLNAIVTKTIEQRSQFYPETIDELDLTTGKLIRLKRNKKKAKTEIRKTLSEAMKLNANWIKEISKTKAFLHEKMTLFWHDHFGVKTPILNAAILHNNTLRKYALDSFRDLLHAIAKDPAMLLFLNSQQNRKNKPNENFARELLELFTVGEGNYTEHDIQEAARAFTGWKTNLQGEFMFVKKRHDFGHKTVLGKSGNLSGEDVINHILDQPMTAEFITRKIYQYFVKEEVNEEIVKELAQFYFESEYDTEQLVKKIFTSDWFYKKENVGVKIKSPVDYLIGILRNFQVTSIDDESIIQIQRTLGQVLFAPPSVAGWTSGRGWIDSSSLLYRQKIVSTLLLGEELEMESREGFDAGDFLTSSRRTKRLLNNFEFNMESYQDLTIEELSQQVLQVNPERVILDKIDQIANEFSGNQQLMKLALLTSLPEYQLF